MTEGIGYFHPQVSRLCEEGDDIVGLDAPLESLQFRFAGFTFDPFWQPGLFVLIDNKAINGLAPLFSVQVLHLGDGNTRAFRHIAIAMGVNANEKIALFDFAQTGLYGFIGTRPEHFHFDRLITCTFYGFNRRSAVVDQIFVRGTNENFHNASP